MNAYQKTRCLGVMDKILQKRISGMFAQPVDPERDGVPTYFQIIDRPMDLGTVRKKLEGDEYPTVQEWKNDVELIWENSYRFNGRNALVSVLARQLQVMFSEETEMITDQPVFDWMLKLDQLRGEVERLSKIGPKPTVVQKSVANKQMSTRQHSERDTPTKKKEKPVSTKPVSKPVAPELTEDQKADIAEKVNALNDDSHIAAVLELITKLEPQLSTNGGQEVEIEISRLKNSTLVALKKLVQSFR